MKPQVAFFEAHGAAGYSVLEDVIAALREAGVLVLADAKRGDIGTTMAAYAAAWAGDSPLSSDAVTASPYLGFGSLRPLLDTAAENGRGVFVLAATSNPEGASVQLAEADGRSVAQSIVDSVADGESLCGNGFRRRRGRCHSVRCARSECSRRARCSSRASARRVVGRTGLRGLGGAAPGTVLPAVSREVLRAGPDVAAVRAAGERMRDAVAYLAD